MKQFLKTRTDTAEALLDILRPLKKYYSTGRAWLHLGNTAAHYGEKASRMEAFSRVLWGLGPLWAGDNRNLSDVSKKEIEDWLALYTKGIINGTDRTNPEYWGDLADHDQKMVEMAALVTAISLSPEKLWNPLTQQQKTNLHKWLNQINEKRVHPNNWRFFRILVNMTFRILRLPWSEEKIKEDFSIIEACYTGDGWYYDGNGGQVDYYIPFAMHFYGLIYTKFMKEEESEHEYLQELLTRARRFSEDFIYWFAGDGTEIPYGRSLTYRFAHSAFFSALAFNDSAGELGYGVIKRTVLGNLRQWLSKPIFDKAGIMTIGYHYPNLFMSERYNASGSPYWSLKTFLVLALPEQHAFWQAEEEEYKYESIRYLKHPHMLITHDDNYHVSAFTAGQHCRNHGNIAAKYEKFVYSNQFGFSVSRGSGLEDGAFDNTLAVSLADEEHYRMRWGMEDYKVTEQFVYAKYQITKHVMIESFIVPLMPWHIRIHRITNDEAIDVADGGFALGTEQCFTIKEGTKSGKYEPEDVIRTENGIFALFPWGISGIVSADGAQCELVQTFPNTSLFDNLAVVPTVKKRLEAGQHLMITSVIGDKSKDASEYIKEVPQIVIENDIVRITKDYQEMAINLN